MANNKSSKKRILINKRNRLQNRSYKTSVKNLIKLFSNNLELYQKFPTLENKEKLQDSMNYAYTSIDKAYNKNVFHKNTAARKKSKLALQLKYVTCN